MSKINIKLVNEQEKFEKVNLVKPNIAFNRLDIKFEKDFELLEINYKSQTQYMTIHLAPYYCQLGVYMMDLDKKVFDAVIKFIVKKFNINRFYLVQSVNGNKKLTKSGHWLLSLPETQEDFDKMFSSRTRYNRRIKRKNLEKDYDCKFTHYKKFELDEKFFEDFLKMKRIGYEDAYKNKTPKEMLSDFYTITDVYTLTIDNKVEAYLLYSILDKDEVYQVNITYNTAYSKYGIGVMLYYYGLENLIKQKVKRLYLGSGDYDYKENSKAIRRVTYDGFFEYIPFYKKILSIQTSIIKGQKQDFIYILGMKIPIKRKNIQNEDYLKYYKKIKLDKKITKLTKDYKDKKIVIYGAGMMSKILLENYDISSLNVVAVCDKSFEENKPQDFYGYKCITPEELKNFECDVVFVVLLKSWEITQVLKYKKNGFNMENKEVRPLID